jgi:hypothetical protein
MPNTLEEFKTPHFVLLDGKSRVGPKTDTRDDDRPALIIYGFSDKKPYEQFCQNSDCNLTPYPLVKFYLQNEVNQNADLLKLVVLDAIAPDQQELVAATMKDVLESHISGSKNVIASYRLEFDPMQLGYRVVEQAKC